MQSFRRATTLVTPALKTWRVGFQSSSMLTSRTLRHHKLSQSCSIHTTACRLQETEKPGLFGGRDPRQIIDECDLILKVNPKEPTALINKAIALHSISHWLEALAVATMAQEVAPSDAQVTLHMLRSECLYQTGKIQEALEEADRAIEGGAQKNGIMGLRAQCLYLLGKDEEALAAAEAACEEQPKNGQLHYVRGSLLHAAGMLQDALGALNRASRYSPDDPVIHLERARVLRELADHEAAKAALQKSLALNPSSPFAHNMMGILLSEEGDLEAAVKSWDTAVQLDPSDVSIISNKGKCLHRMHHYSEAVDVFKKALELGATEGYGVHASMGECLTFLGRFDEAVEVLEVAIKQQPEDGMLHALSAFALRALGKLDPALEAVQRACELDDERSNWHAMRGQLLEAAGKSDDAIAALEKSLKLDCKSADAADVYYSRGMIRGKKGDVEGAMHDVDAALQLNAEHLYANTKKAQWLEEQGKNEEALAIWDKLVASGKDDIKTLTYRGKCLSRLSRTEEAKKEFLNAIDKGPGNSEPHKALGALYWHEGLKKEAYDLWAKGSMADPTDVYCYFLQGVYLSEVGQLETALEVLDKAIKFSGAPAPEILELRNEVANLLVQIDNAAQDEK